MSQFEELNKENAALKEQVTNAKYNYLGVMADCKQYEETIAQQAKIIKQMQEALSIAMINGDYLPNERKQLEKFL